MTRQRAELPLPLVPRSMLVPRMLQVPILGACSGLRAWLHWGEDCQILGED